MNLTWHEPQQLPPVFIYEPEFVEVEEKAATENDWTIERDGDGYVVTRWLGDKIMGSVNIDDYESCQYMDRMLQSAGIYTKLEEMGIEEGAPVVIESSSSSTFTKLGERGPLGPLFSYRAVDSE